MIDKEIKDHLVLAENAISMNDYETAAMEYQIASDKGSPYAKIGLAALYSTGMGVECNGIIAIKLLEEVINNGSASRQQLALAFNNISTLYFTGAQFLSPNMGLAKDYRIKAEALGFPKLNVSK
jgi:TPR repeat protein